MSNTTDLQRLAHPDADPTVSETSLWPEPVPLPGGLAAVKAFDFDLLPDTLRPWVEDIADRMQLAPDYIAIGVMTGLGSIVGRKVGIRPQQRSDWTEHANMWGLVIGRPGLLKSPAMAAAMAPLKHLASAASRRHDVEIEEWALSAKAAKLKAEVNEKAARRKLAESSAADVADLLKDDTPDAPVLRRYVVNDTSVAALGEVLRHNPNGVLVFRDEMVSLLRTLDREDQSEARGFYLTAWNGNSSYTVDRIGRGMNLHIQALCISMLGTTQPGKIAEYARHAVLGGSGDDGLIQRFGLMVWPDTPREWRNVDKWPDQPAKDRAFAVYDRLDRLTTAQAGAQQDVGADGSPDGIPYLRFDGCAAEVFLEWRTRLELRLRGNGVHPAMEAHIAKYRKLVPALALVLHLADGGVGAIGVRPMLQALAWAEYLESHATRIYGSVINAETDTAKRIVDRIRRGDLPREFPSWQVLRPGWAGLSDRALVSEALATLVELGWLRTEQRATAGRSGTVYMVNPRGMA